MKAKFLRYVVHNPAEIYGNWNHQYFSELRKAVLVLKPGGFIVDKFGDGWLSKKIIKIA